MTVHQPVEPEFSRPVDLARVGPEGFERDIEATEAERGALSERFGLLALDALRARVGLRWLGGGRRLRLRLHLVARVVQSCVVTLEPVEKAIDESVEIFYEPVEEGATPGEIVIATSADAEPLDGDSLDIGEIVSEELAVSLDPYPRAQGAAGLGEDAENGDREPSGGPFQELARLKRDV